MQSQSSHHHEQSQKHHYSHHLHYQKTPQKDQAREKEQSHQDEIVDKQYDQSWCSSDTSHQKDGQGDNQISTHELELIHDGSKRCLYPRRRRQSKDKRGSRDIGSIFSNSNVSLLLLGGSRLLARSFSLRGQLGNAPLQRSLTDSTYDREERGKRNRNVHMC